METQSTKRRKISPSPLVESNARQGQTRWTQAAEEAVQTNGDRTTPTRASYMTPTKASLARFHPGLLPPLTSTGSRSPSKRRAPSQARRKLGKAGLWNGTSDEVKTATISEQQPHDSIPRTNGRLNGRSGSDAGRQQTLDSEHVNAGAQSQGTRRALRNGDANVFPAIRVPKLPQDIRASPPPVSPEALDLIQEPVNGQLGQGLTEAPVRQPLLHQIREGPSSPTARRIERDDDGEPRLPSTPSQLGLEPPPEPPKGLQSSSPSRRSKRRKRSALESSPLKPREEPFKELAPRSRERSSLGSRVYLANGTLPPSDTPQGGLHSKQKELEQLSEQIKVLQMSRVHHAFFYHGTRSGAGLPQSTLAVESKRIVRLAAWIQRLRRELLGLRKIAVEAEANDLIEMRGLCVGTERGGSLKELRTASSVAQSLSLHLPFAPASISAMTPPPSPQAASEAAWHSWVSNDQDNFMSTEHFTINVTRNEILPSDPGLMEKEDRDDVLHAISFQYSLAELQLNIEITINIIEQRIVNLNAKNISPWATTTLQSAFPKQDVDFGEILTLATMLRLFWELTCSRRSCWRSCFKAFPNLVDEDEMSSDSSLLGRRQMIFSRSSVSVTVSWDILLSNTGEFATTVGADATFPPSWRQDPSGEALSNVSEVFESLRQRKGTLGAIKTICGLIYLV